MSNGSEQSAQLTPLKRAFLAIEELQARLEAAERARHEPIAIVGVGLRFPHGVDSPEAYWQLLCDGVDAIGPIPPERWDVDAYFDPDPAAPGKMAQREGGFLREVDRFDAQFFGIAPREAEQMDPQQRLLLEVAWEALERAGQAPAGLAGSRTGVFVGVTAEDYRSVCIDARGLEGLDAYFASGNAQSIVSGRLSYVLGLEGPSLTLDTACSSSLVAVHLAVQSLRSGECPLALAGAVNLILSPENSITLSKYQMLAPDARCKFGDARADGFVRAEGCAVVVLKRLRDALADGDPVLAVIRGTAVNQDGASSGLTAPNGPSQEAVLRAALADAGVAPADVGYVEAHGTGTSLGDPIELQALGAVLGAGRDPAHPLVVGSVKTNLGHMEAAAGMAGLIKLVLMLQQGRIPPSLHFETPTPHVAWEELPLRVPVALEPWPEGGRRIAGVSSFGFSGTNAHLLLEARPDPAAPPAQAPVEERPLHLLALSAQSEGALRELAARYADLLSASGSSESRPRLPDVAFTANSGRSHFAHRLALVAAEDKVAAAAQALAACARGEAAAGLRTHTVTRADPPRVAFLFTGQGAQYAGMGRALYRQQPLFRAALDRCAAILAPHLDRPLLDLLFAEPGSPDARALDETTYTQPALVALQVALAELWRSWGLEPAAVIGHSVGEYAAAIVAGVLSLEDGLGLVAARGRLMGRLPAGGAMAALFAPAAEVEAALAECGGRAVVAAYNGPEHTTVAGPEDAVRALVERFAAAGRRAQRLNVSHAFHSPLLDPVLADLERAAGSVAWHAPRLRLISNLSGGSAGPEIATPAYWRRHAREPVRFAQGIEQLARLGCELFIEIGPHPTLIGMAQAVLPPEVGVWLPSLRKGRDDWQVLLDSLAAAYTRGAAIGWAAFDRPYARRRLVLPTYPFQRERYWVEPQGRDHGRARLSASARRTSGSEHPLLGRRLRSALRQAQFEQEIGPGSLAYLDDHRVFGRTILPAAAFAELALAAARAALGVDLPALDDLVIHAPLVVEAEEPRTIQTVVTPAAAGATVEVFSQGAVGEEWTLHARAAALPAALPAWPASLEVEATAPADARARCTEEASVDAHYAALRARGLELGPSLQALHWIGRGEGEAVGAIAPVEAETAASAHYLLHPALLDACLQLLAAALPPGSDTYLPIALDRLRVYAKPQGRILAHARLLPAANTAAARETLTGEIRLYDEQGGLVAALDGLRLKRAAADALRRPAQAADDWLYAVAWRPVPDGAPGAAAACLAPTPALRAAVQERGAQLDAELELSHYRTLTPALERLATDFIVRALEELGWQPQPGARVTAGGLADALGVAPGQRALLGRFLAILAEEGWLRAQGNGSLSGSWEVVQTPRPSAATEGRAEALAARFPAARGDIEMTRRCGEGLAEALRGALDPLQLLFPGGSLATAEQLYRESPLARAYTALVGEAVAAAAAALPPGRTLRVLEVGGGTGGATAAVLPRLDPSRTAYTFTDISPLFLARARESFAAFPFVEYQTLDIEAEPEAQGFAANGYDLVIAANVVHATADLRRSLANLRRLLAPAGALLLLEMTAPLRWIDISFGLTSGWWKFGDHDLRPDYPLLDRDAWLALLRDVGPEAPAAFAVPGLELQHILYARTPGETAREDESLPHSLRRVLVFADESGTGEHLAALLAARGGHAALVHRGERFAQTGPDRYTVAPAARDDFARLLGAEPQAAGSPAQEGWDGVVYLWPLDAPALAAQGGAPADVLETLLGGALHLAQALLSAGAESRLWLATRGAQPVGGAAADPAQATLWGFAKSLAREHPELHTVCVDLDPAPDAVGERAVGERAADLLDAIARGGEPELALRDGQRLAARLVRAAAGVRSGAPPSHVVEHAAETEPVALVITARGALDNVALRSAARREPGPGEVEIRVAATALNFKDVLNLLGMYPGDPGPPGSECAGTVIAVGPGVLDLQPGDAVVAVTGGCFRSHLTVGAEWVARAPAGLRAEQAASIPIAYITAAFALHHLGRMQAGERVLIHAAAGGVGLAAVHLARRAGAQIFATAGSPAKRAYLQSLGVEHVFDSRSLSFAEEVRAATGGEGVDLVLNSLAGEFVLQSLDLLRPGGRFLEIGKRDAATAARAAEWVAASPKGIVDHVIDWGEDARTNPALIRGLLHEALEGVAHGDLPLLPLCTFPLEDAPAAFRYMAQARHTGKVVVTQGAGAPLVRPDAAYLITGGLGGLGLLTARWLVARGARHLVLMGRRGADAHAQAEIAAMEQAGARVLAVRGDVAQADAVAAVLARCAAELPPLRGIVHSAGVLDDGAIPQQEWARFRRVLAPKVDGAWHLHTQTAALPLDFFVIYSSAASLIGSPGQANHAAANAFLDALAHRRRADGLPALSINWGAWSEVGAAVATGALERGGARGLGEIAPLQGLELLGRLLEAAPPQVGVLPIDWPTFLARFGGSPPAYFDELAAAAGDGAPAARPAAVPAQPAAPGPEPARAPEIMRRLAEATPQRRLTLLRDFVRETTGHVLGLPPARIDDERPLSALGLDSLMAVELRNLLGAGLGLPRRLPATLVFDYPHVAAMTDYLAAEALALALPADEKAPAPAPAADGAASGAAASGAGVATMIDTLEDLSDDEVDRLLAAKLRGGE